MRQNKQNISEQVISSAQPIAQEKGQGWFWDTTEGILYIFSLTGFRRSIESLQNNLASNAFGASY
jgi:hypothetical protein